jgi:membrane-associated phospholipid phosphatase
VPNVLIVLVLTVLWLVLARDLGFQLSAVPAMFYAGMASAALAYVLSPGHLKKFFSCILYLGGIPAFGIVSTMVGAAAGLPLRDGLMLRADAALGFDWLGLVGSIAAEPLLSSLLMLAYQCFDVGLPITLVAVTILADRDHLDRVAWSFFVALNLTAIGSLIAPCVSAPPFLGLPDQIGAISLEIPHRSAAVVDLLRAGDLRDFRVLIGVATMPSFHTSGAILFVWALWPLSQLRLLRLPLAALAALITLSAIPVGGHYLVDVLAGVCVALVSIASATARPVGATLVQACRNASSRLTASRHVSSAPANESRM